MSVSATKIAAYILPILLATVFLPFDQAIGRDIQAATAGYKVGEPIRINGFVMQLPKGHTWKPKAITPSHVLLIRASSPTYTFVIEAETRSIDLDRLGRQEVKDQYDQRIEDRIVRKRALSLLAQAERRNTEKGFLFLQNFEVRWGH